ncbi:MAG: ribbon-helix-helix protein, CopG family [Gammaproteobacteria bacterium]|nr:ribbon-helix-helix protein, CopG family [Rhodocyclaceae bacterium]MBU3908737.1 ribbon-helix-helix protein, CopG family [Gammaproteobacteria bacterium]MBU3988859.1 ribbon-helix-helix protein, CopG family [Gammaproteobacteria bacterium]MBU4004765.1 ribbon-helix-helix protein, CopG family [Gammaproteobacteria bacterium]MBU4021368.1 ribbon-helix-helix protein, CopG family [Gammaproteobacteria bacterium]
MSNSDQRILTRALRLRCSPADEAAIREKACDAGATISAFLRAAALGRKTRSTTDSQTINELRRIGGMLKDQFNKSGGQYSRESAATLTEITQAISRIAGNEGLIK